MIIISHTFQNKFFLNIFKISDHVGNKSMADDVEGTRTLHVH